MKLKAYRKQQGLTRAEASRQLGVTWITVWRYEEGRILPSAQMQKAIAKWSSGAVTPNDWLGVKAA